MKTRDFLVLIAVAVLAIGVLYSMRGTLHSYPCDASGSDPRCGGISGPAAP